MAGEPHLEAEEAIEPVVTDNLNILRRGRQLKPLQKNCRMYLGVAMLLSAESWLSKLCPERPHTKTKTIGAFREVTDQWKCVCKM